MRSASPLALRTATEPRRLQILEMIWDRERSAGEIAAALPVSFGAVSQHLRRLLEADLVTVRRDGRHRFYRARTRHMGTLAVLLESMWNERLDVLARMAEAAEAGVGSRGDSLSGAPRPKPEKATENPEPEP